MIAGWVQGGFGLRYVCTVLFRMSRLIGMSLNGLKVVAIPARICCTLDSGCIAKAAAQTSEVFCLYVLLFQPRNKECLNSFGKRVPRVA